MSFGNYILDAQHLLSSLFIGFENIVKTPTDSRMAKGYLVQMRCGNRTALFCCAGLKMCNKTSYHLMICFIIDVYRLIFLFKKSKHPYLLSNCLTMCVKYINALVFVFSLLRFH